MIQRGNIPRNECIRLMVDDNKVKDGSKCFAIKERTNIKIYFSIFCKINSRRLPRITSGYPPNAVGKEGTQSSKLEVGRECNKCPSEGYDEKFLANSRVTLPSRYMILTGTHL